MRRRLTGRREGKVLRMDILRAASMICLLTIPLCYAGCLAGDGTGLDANGDPLVNAPTDSGEKPSKGESSNDDPQGGDNGEGTITGELQPTWRSIQDNVFTPICTLCHKGASAPQGLQLDEDHSWQMLIVDERHSQEQPNLREIEPGDPDNSYMIRKIEGQPTISGGQMPLGLTPLPPSTLDVMRQWVAAGAPRNTVSKPGILDVLAPALPGVPRLEVLARGPVVVRWDAAVDELDPAEAIRYDVIWHMVGSPQERVEPVAVSGRTVHTLLDVPGASAVVIQVRARDRSGNVSERSTAVEVVTR